MRRPHAQSSSNAVHQGRCLSQRRISSLWEECVASIIFVFGSLLSVSFSKCGGALVLHRDNLKEAGQSDGKLRALVDDNAAQFAALGLGTLPGRSGEAKQVRPLSN